MEHATFTPLVLSATGGLARQAAVFYKRLEPRLHVLNRFTSKRFEAVQIAFTRN